MSLSETLALTQRLCELGIRQRHAGLMAESPHLIAQYVYVRVHIRVLRPEFTDPVAVRVQSPGSFKLRAVLSLEPGVWSLESKGVGRVHNRTCW